jgi:PPOX class probable F420-dependent enzyme
MDESEARRRFAAARVARLATVTADGAPHLVPIVFAIEDDVVYSSVDAKPKRTSNLRRLANIGAERRVTVLVDEYDERWERLWWVRADGRAEVIHDGPLRERALGALRDKYPQYREEAQHREEPQPAGVAVVIRVDRLRWWSASGD